MLLLNTTVKKARYTGVQASQFNTYVTLKLQNVKSTTVTVKGATPSWEQDFLFETDDVNTGLLIEVWSKGMIWDRALGYHFVPLKTVQYSNEEGNGQWLSLEAELVMYDGEVVGTKIATGHSILVDCRFELPFDPENIEAADLQRKLEMLNNIVDQEARAEQARRQIQYLGHSGYSEDSDYTSDLNYPIGQHANSSASQFRGVANQIHTPQRSLETSRENSYERDDGPNSHSHHHLEPYTIRNKHLSPGLYRQNQLPYYSPNEDEYSTYGNETRENTSHIITQDINSDSEPLFYNSRPPRHRTDYSSNFTQETWLSCESGEVMDLDYPIHSSIPNKVDKVIRRPSLERQDTLYDDYGYVGGEHYTDFSKAQNLMKGYYKDSQDSEYFDAFPIQEELYLQNDEDRQWDSGGGEEGYYPPPMKPLGNIIKKKLPSVPTIQNQINKSYPYCSNYDYEDRFSTGMQTPSVHGGKRKMPQIPTKTSISSSLNEQDIYFASLENSSHIGASLPPTPTKNIGKLLPRVATQNQPFNSLPPTPGRQLPKVNPTYRSAKARRKSIMKRTTSAENAESDICDNYYLRQGAISAREMYNEDYNYAYQSIDNLPTPPEKNYKNDDLVDSYMPMRDEMYSNNHYGYINNSSLETIVQDNVVTSTVPVSTEYSQVVSETEVTSTYPPTTLPTISSVSTGLVTTGVPSVPTVKNQVSSEPTVPTWVPSVPTVSNWLQSVISWVPSVPTEVPSATTEIPTVLDEVPSVPTEKASVSTEVSTEVPSELIWVSSVETEVPSVSTVPNDSSCINNIITTSDNLFVATSLSSAKNSSQYYGEYSYNHEIEPPIVQPVVNALEHNSVGITQFNGDQLLTKAIVNNAIKTSDKPLLNINNNNNTTEITRGILTRRQEESIDNYEKPLDECGYDKYFNAQDSVETYVEEENLKNNVISEDYGNNKAIIESPSTVIQQSIDQYEDAQSLRRGSSQITVVDPYHPHNVPVSISSRKSSAADVISIRRSSKENYISYDESYVSPSGKKTVDDAITRRTSLRRSPTPQTVEEADEQYDHFEEHQTEETIKSASFEEEENKEARPQITAQQRWLWAYNKITMQLNFPISERIEHKLPNISSEATSF